MEIYSDSCLQKQQKKTIGLKNVYVLLVFKSLEHSDL